MELFVIVSENYFPASCLKVGSKFFFYILRQLLGHSPFPIQDGILALLKCPTFFFRSRAQYKWITRSFHEIAANACGSNSNDYLVTVTIYLDWKFWGSCWGNTFSVPILFCKPCRVMTSIDCSCFGGGGMILKDPTFFLCIKLPISSCKTYRTVVGVSDSLLSDPVIELRCFVLSIRESTTSGSARPTDSSLNRLIHEIFIWFWRDTLGLTANFFANLFCVDPLSCL